jgi:hypothetical protein
MYINSTTLAYFVINSGGFSHTMRFSSLSSSSNVITLTFADEAGGTITTTNTSAAGGVLIVDGNSYAFNITDATNKKIKMDLNRDSRIANASLTAPGLENAAATIAGVGYSFLTPKLISSGQGGTYFYKGSAGDINTTGAWTYPDIGIGAIRWVLADDITTVTAASRAPTATAWTNETALALAGDGLIASAAYTVNNIDYYIHCLNTTGDASATCTVGLGTSNATNRTYPGIVLIEEQQEGGSTRNWVHVPFNYSTTNVRASTNAPVSDDTAFSNEQTAIIGTTGQNKGMTTYGTLVEWDTTSGTANLNYPDSFVYANIYVMEPTGTISTGGSTGTITTDVVVPIVTDVVRLDSEVTDSDKTNRDLVLLGGPCINTLVASLAADGDFDYACDSWPGRDFGMVKVVNDAFASGKAAIVIAGTRAADTDLAASVVQAGIDNSADTVEITGSVSSPTITPM